MTSPDSPALRQAKEIAHKFRDRPEEKAAAAVAAHIRLFWDLKMQRLLKIDLGAGRIDDPVLMRAIAQLDD